jgi:hypothetical protein
MYLCIHRPLTCPQRHPQPKPTEQQETKEFVKCLAEDGPVPCSGEDGLIALVMAIAAEKSALEGRWVDFKEIPINAIHCDPSGTHCSFDETEVTFN